MLQLLSTYMDGSVEKELAIAEKLASSAVVAKLKTEYDGDLRKEHPSVRIKFQYGYILCCSKSRGQMRRGIDLLTELQALLEREIETKKRGASFSSPSSVMLHHLSPQAESDQDKREEDEESKDAEYVILDKKALAKEIESELEEESKDEEGLVEDAEEENILEDSFLPQKNISTRKEFMLEPFPENDCSLLEMCIYYRAVGFYRLGEYSHAITACESLLRMHPSHAKALCLKNMSTYGLISRRAAGILFTVGFALPAAYFWHKSVGSTARSFSFS